MKNLVERVEQTLTAQGYGQSTDNASPSPMHYSKNLPFTNCYGGQSRSPFVLHHPKQGLVRLDCRAQHQSGTTDQKFPYLLECAKGVPESTVIFIIDGHGFKPRAIDFLRKGALAISSKKVKVMTLTEFTTWLSTSAKAA